MNLYDYEVIQRQLLVPSIRMLALTYSVPSSKLYDILIPCDLKSEAYDRKGETRNSFKRLANIMKRLSLENEDNNEELEGKKGRDVQERLFINTIFSQELPDLMISEYNAFAKMVDAPEMISEYRRFLRVRKNWCISEGKKETAFAFPEAMALASLYLSHYRRAISTLNKSIQTENQKTRARGRFKRIKMCLISKQLHDKFAKFIVEYSQNWCIAEYKTMEYEYTREYRLPERFCCTKDIRYATARHYIKDVNNIDTSAWGMSKFNRFQMQHRELEYLYYYLECVCPIMEKILTGEIPDNMPIAEDDSRDINLEPYIGKASTVTSVDYLIACKAAKTVNSYIQCAYDSAKYLLSCLKEADDLDNRPFLEYFNRI